MTNGMMIVAMLMGAVVSADADDTMRWEKGDGIYTLLEGTQPVLVFQDAFVEPPAGVKAMERRRGYIHPVYGLDGEMMTEDFPRDHYHHRGVFWSWPDSTVGDKLLDNWELDSARSYSIENTIEDDTLTTVSFWALDDAPEQRVIEETVLITPHPATEVGRAIDFDLHFKNVCDEDVIIRGAKTDNKGYGGFSVRPNSARIPFKFTSKHGPLKGEHLEHDSPWVDISYPLVRRGEEKSGYAIFQHPDNPGYPHPGWLIRLYGFLGQSWPHREPLTLSPGDSFSLKYRLYIHRGDAEEGQVKRAFDEYIETE